MEAPVANGKYVRPNCDCVGKKGKGKPVICPHHNHAVDPNGSTEHWHPEKNNNVRPENVSRGTGTKYWYKCPNEWCQMAYEQSPKDRTTRNGRCPYCAHQKVCEWNCLLTNYPELCLEYDSENEKTPDQIHYGSHEKVKWFHTAPDGTIHRWETEVRKRTVRDQGCGRCNINGADQRFGGHEHFIKEIRKVHGDKYIYNDQYEGDKIKLRIYCPAKSPDGEIHGDFFQTPHNHKTGQNCPKCGNEQVESKLITDIRTVLTLLTLGYVLEQTFEGLKYIANLWIDVVVPIFSLCLEGDGRQHFEAVAAWGGEEALKLNRERDVFKDGYCIKHKYNLVRIPYTKSPAQIREIIDRAIVDIKAGHQVYVTYRDYYDAIEPHIKDLAHFKNLKVTIISV